MSKSGEPKNIYGDSRTMSSLMVVELEIRFQMFNVFKFHGWILGLRFEGTTMMMKSIQQ